MDPSKKVIFIEIIELVIDFKKVLIIRKTVSIIRLDYKILLKSPP